MAKSSGLADNLYFGGFDVSGDTRSVEMGGGPGVIDTTSIDLSAMARVGGTRDGRMNFTSLWNPGAAADDAHAVYSVLPTTDVNLAYAAGTAVGDPAAVITAKQINYDGTRGTDGEFTLDVACQGNGYGLQWGSMQTAGVHDSTGAETLGTVTYATQTLFGGQAYVYVTEFTGTSADIKIEDSTGAGWNDLPGGAFTTITGVGSERIATTLTETVDRLTRLDVTGTFTTMSFAVVFVRNETATVF